MLVLGGGLTCPAFVAALHASLRALIDGLGVQTFNCGLLNVSLEPSPLPGAADVLEGDAAMFGDGLADGRRSAMCGEDSPTAASGHGVISAAGGGDAAYGSDVELGLPPVEVGWRPVMARVVSRGKVTSPASDFGCLEVIGHASIGHTDPFLLIRMIDMQLAKVNV